MPDKILKFSLLLPTFQTIFEPLKPFYQLAKLYLIKNSNPKVISYIFLPNIQYLTASGIYVNFKVYFTVDFPTSRDLPLINLKKRRAR